MSLQLFELRFRPRNTDVGSESSLEMRIGGLMEENDDQERMT